MVDNLICNRFFLLVLNPHEMLFGLIPGENDDFFWRSSRTGKESLDQHLAKGAGTPRYYDSFAIK